jgi:hypothetical protein
MVVPTGAIVASLFALSCGIVFIAQVLNPGNIASMRPVFEFSAWLILFLCPAITMRLIAEERRVGTWELLLSSPSSSFEIAKAKFLASFLFLCVILATTFPLVFVLELYSSVDYGAVLSGYLGLLLLGGAVIATGLVISASTTSQTVAYLVTTFFWLTLSLATKVLPSYVPTRFADIIYAIDPDLRTSEFSIGLIDTANIVYFVLIIFSMGWVTIIAIDRTKKVSSSIWKICISSVLLVIAVVAINSIAMSETARSRFDATGSRAYTLSEQSQQLLSSLEKPWKIVILLDDSKVSRPVLRQVDEVLRRYSEGSEKVQIERINPANPNAITQYDALLRNLIQLYSEELTSAEKAVDQAVQSFHELMLFASTTSVWAEGLLAVPMTQKEEETFRVLASSLALLGNDGDLILNEVDKTMRVSGDQPLPKISRARDILVAATGKWSQELAEVAWWLQEKRTSSIAAMCAEYAESFEQMAIQLAQSDDELRRLGKLELGQLAQQLAVGEGAIILSPDRATMIPARVMFPSSGINQDTTAVDYRFRGEQIISSAMRSLQSPLQPTVVFVHAEEGSILGKKPNNVDVWAARGLLETSRFAVREWAPHDGTRPNVQEGPVVWVVIPPSNRAGLSLSAREQSLLEATRGLLAGNEPVLLNVQPSLLPRYGQTDPWSKLAESIGVRVDTERVLVEQVAVGPNQIDVQRAQMIDELHSDHLVARAVNGRQLFLPFPLQVQGGDALMRIEPTEDHWLDAKWETEVLNSSGKTQLHEPIQLASAIEHHGGARAIVMGSGGWLLSWALDRAVSLGGNQVAMVNPGNSELLIASVEWLSGLDDWIAASPIGQQSSRVTGLSKTMYFAWAILLIVGVPCILILFAVTVFMRRQGR